MKLKTQLLLSVFLLFSVFQTAWADNETKLNVYQSFIFFWNQFKDEVPDSYQYISLDYKWVVKWGRLEDALQILIYKDLIKNAPVIINPESIMTVSWFNKLSTQILWIGLTGDENQSVTDTQEMYYRDLSAVQEILDQRKNKTITITSGLGWSTNTLWKQGKILEDVYNTIKKDYYNGNSLSDEELISWAIKWMTDAVWDKYTSYFPPVESSEFISALEGEFEWIGAYIEMPTPWELIIVSPISWSPAENAGLKWGDRVLSVDGKEVTAENPVNEVVSWIKGPAGTTVKLSIQREWEKEPLEFIVTRDKIVIKDVEFSKPDRNTAYVEIKSFWDKVDSQFKNEIKKIAEDLSVRKIIFDVRNNPGGYLWKVSNILDYLLPVWEITTHVKYSGTQLDYTSKMDEILDLNKYEVVILQNGGSASASEIFTGTIKDYFPNTTIIWEQSFGKWSVQTLKNYYDGSTLKLTTAKWFTGKTRTTIEWVGITPDIVVPYDLEKWTKLKIDNQLKQALDL